MTKKFTHLMLLMFLMVSTGSWAQTFSNKAATVTWAVGNESDAMLSEGIGGAISLTSVKMGSDLTLTSSSQTYDLGSKVGPYCVYQPSTSNPGCVATDMVEYTVKVKKGLTFTLTNVQFDLVKEGTDGAYITWSYTVDEQEGDKVAYDSPKTQIRRNNNANPDAPLTHNETISGAAGGQVVTLRFYLSNVANNKKMAIGNVNINGTINGEVAQRAFKDFKIDFRTDPYTVVYPEGGLPEGVAVTAGNFHDAQHGYQGNTALTIPVDGPVKFIVGGCQYSNQAAVVKDANGATLYTLDTKGAGCDTNTSFDHSVTWTYNSETAQTLTIELGQYCPYVEVKACDLIPSRTVTYYNTDGKTVLGSEEVDGGSELKYKYTASDVTVPEGSKFRGWFNSTQNTALKVAEGTPVQDNLSLYAKATPIEVAKVGAIFTYPLNSTSFYKEDHECFSTTGAFHDAQHGYSFSAGQNVAVKVAGNAVVVFGLCQYSGDGNITVKDEAGNTVATFAAKGASDGATESITYTGPATTLTATCGGTTYIHNLTVYNIENVPVKNEAGYYELAANDGASLQLVLAALKSGDKIYLPNGVYDFGEKALTTISAGNVSIIGESMEGTIIRNAPAKETEGIGTTATLLNTSNGLYLQDLTIQNALDYYATGAAGRAVCLQDKGQNTICKNVRMLSYQDTYYSNAASRFYWEDSEIHGTVDYLCGDGDVVYNRCKFVNESRAKDSNTGSDVIAAPYTSASCQWGYVFLDCSVESACKDFTFARSWGGDSKAQYIRTKILDNSLNASRWTVGGMNIAAYKFKEFGTMDKDGNITTPASNVVNFTHSSGNKEYETVLSAVEAAGYTVENIYGTWAPDKKCAQVTDVTQGTVFLADGKITTVCPASGKVRVANERGGFGPEIDLGSTAITAIEAGAAGKHGKYIKDGAVVITSNGKTFNLAGQIMN